MGIFRPWWRKNGKSGRSKNWWLDYGQNGKRIRVNLKVTDKRSAEIKAAAIMKKSELAEAGVTDPFEKHRARPLDEHIADFEVFLVSRNVVERYLRCRMTSLRTFAQITRAKTLSDLDGTN